MRNNASDTSTAWKGYYEKLRTPDTTNVIDYPTSLNKQDDFEAKGRYSNLTSRFDELFPRYHANRYFPEKDKYHIVLEGPALHDQHHCERFLECLTHPELTVTDIIAAGDPLDGRVSSKGFFDYFSVLSQADTPDEVMRKTLVQRYEIVTQEVSRQENINQYELVLTKHEGEQSSQHRIRVHQLATFKDFGTQTFSCQDIEHLVDIYQKATVLAIHCSAGMGRSGVIELTYMLFANYDHYFPNDKPAFNNIKKCLETLREKRPALVQTPDQFRMAIILAQQCQLAAAHQLTDKASEDIEEKTDETLVQYYQEKKSKREQLTKSRVDIGGYRFYDTSRETLTDDDGLRQKTFNLSYT